MSPSGIRGAPENFKELFAFRVGNIFQDLSGRADQAQKWTSMDATQGFY
jgi:hypothetical protein